MSIKPITTTVNEKDHLEIGGIDVVDLAGQHGTPLYVIDEATLRNNCQQYKRNLTDLYDNHLIVYAGKANLTIGLLNILHEEGFGVDVVSGGELFTALKSNMDPSNIIFHGNNKSLDELQYCIDNNIRIVVDNEQEIANLISLTKTSKKSVRILLRLKPEIDAHTHEYIKTGQIDSKFGIDKEDIIRIIKELSQLDHFDILGLHSHIGSQIFDIVPYEDLVDLMVSHTKRIKDEVGIELKELNLGGGLGMQYTSEDDPPEVKSFLNRLITRFKTSFTESGLSLPKLILEPGRSIIGNAGVTIYSVGTIKTIPNIKNYIFVDGGMADNPRPIMYQAEYTFDLGNKANSESTVSYSIAGKYCESGDILANNISLPKSEVGDLLVVYGTGAYNYSMASNYNRACKPAMVLVNNGDSKLLVKRETYEDLVRYDTV